MIYLVTKNSEEANEHNYRGEINACGLVWDVGVLWVRVCVMVVVGWGGFRPSDQTCLFYSLFFIFFSVHFLAPVSFGCV